MKSNFTEWMVLVIKLGGRRQEEFIFAIFKNLRHKRPLQRTMNWLMGGKYRGNIKKSPIFCLRKLSVTSSNSVLCLSSFSLCMRSRHHITLVIWGKIKRKTTGGRGAHSWGDGLLPHWGYCSRSKQSQWHWVCSGSSDRHKICLESRWKGHVTARAKICWYSHMFISILFWKLTWKARQLSESEFSKLFLKDFFWWLLDFPSEKQGNWRLPY